MRRALLHHCGPALLWSVVGVLCWILTGCGTLDAPGPAKLVKPGSPGSETRLRIGDQIQVRLETGGAAPEPTKLYDLTIDENGQIALPLVGQLPAAGKTPAELAIIIQERYVPRYYMRCSALVLTAPRFFYVGGEVKSPGRFQWTEDVTLIKAINTAGGFTDYANRGKVEVIRESAKQTYDYEELRRNPAQDVPIRPGDSIWVPRGLF